MFDPFPGERSRARQQDISRASRRATERGSVAEHSPVRGPLGQTRGRVAAAMATRLRRTADRLDYRWTLEDERAANPSRSGTDL